MRTAAAALILVCLVGAVVVAVAAMIHGAGKFEWNMFYPWVLGPYIVLLAIFSLPRTQSRPRLLAGGIAAAVVFFLTCWFYIGAMWFSKSSTAALIFIFAPVYVFFGGLVVWGISFFLLSRRHVN